MQIASKSSLAYGKRWLRIAECSSVSCVNQIQAVQYHWPVFSPQTDEYILQHANRVPEGQSNFNQAPEPLLPNYGAGRIRQYNLDMDMLAMLNSEERQLDDFVRLGEGAGLKFEKLWDFGEMGLVEYRLPAWYKKCC